VTVTFGETVTEPEVPEAVKPVPLQLVALVLDQVRIVDWVRGMFEGEAERVAVGAACALAAIAAKQARTVNAAVEQIDLYSIPRYSVVGVDMHPYHAAAAVAEIGLGGSNLVASVNAFDDGFPDR
jgi:hypothetical protein